MQTLAIIFSILFAGVFAWMNYALHENRLWFSAIEEVEREISLRTECGLYYSYYKQIINTSETINKLSIVDGFIDAVSQLIDDRQTEAPNSINIIQRFNIFQEILLAALYRVSKSIYVFTVKSFNNSIDSLDLYISPFPTPIFFYTYACFMFAGLATFAIYWLTLSLCDEKDTRVKWSAGLLAVAWLFYNLEDASRVYFTLNLRENFALPLFWLQNYYVIRVLHNGIIKMDTTSKKNISNKFNYLFIFVTTLLFSAFWQFNQFVLTLQSTALFAALILIGYNKCICQQNIERTIYNILVMQLVSFLLLIGLQGFQRMLLTAISNQFTLAILVSIKLMNHFFGSRRNFIAISLIHIFTVFGIVILFTLIRCLVFNIHSDDSHIWEFTLAKISHLMRLLSNFNFTTGLSTPYSILELADVPFESAIYLCHGAFAFLDINFFDRTSKSGLFPLYILSILCTLIVAFRNILITYNTSTEEKYENQGRSLIHFELMRPSILYFSIQSLLSGVMALLMLRLKYLWLPQMAVISAFFASKALDTFVGKQIRTVLVIAIAAGLLSKRYEMFRAEISVEQEFYDPNTVELMNWISHNTPPEAIFAGSMQLMAGVKCCSNRPIANHPHFEDRILRQRTQRLYQIYAKKSPEEVYNILRAEKIDYIVVEESICFIAPSGCSTGELMDLINRHIPIKSWATMADSPNTMEELFRHKGFKSVNKPRFCEKVREFGKQSSSMFKLALQNPTFRVYKVL